jgi:hypothetical protein
MPARGVHQTVHYRGGAVRVLRPASEPEVVAGFLSAELDSARFGPALRRLLRDDGADVSVVTSPNLDDEDENAYRAGLLDRHRGWLQRIGLFAGFPQRVDWWRAALTPDEVLAIRYINWDWWLDVSAGTRDPRTTAERIRAGDVPGVTAEGHEPIAAQLATGAPELIVVSLPGGSTRVVVEGHARLTAYALFPERLPEELEVFLGTAADMHSWTEF